MELFVRLCARYWTGAEEQELFQHYFDGVGVMCPVCAESVKFRMNHTREIVTLSARCGGCNNIAILFFGGLIGMPAERVDRF